jgi:DNA-binding transcriptional ArsR family regulator
MTNVTWPLSTVSTTWPGGPPQLKKAGLLTERRDGTRRLYQLRPEALRPARAALDEFWPDALARLKQAVETGHPTGDDPRP